MTFRTGLTAVAVLSAALLLLLLLILLFIPGRELQGVVERGLAREGYSFRAARFDRTYPLGVAARDIRIATEAGEVFRAETVALHLRILPLLRGKVVLDLDARIGAGIVRGELAPFGTRSLALDIKGVRLDDIPYFASVAKVRVQGALEIHGNFRGNPATAVGTLQLEVKGAEVGGVRISELPLPDASYRNVQGMLRATAGKLNLESFTLDGEGLYARLKGDLPLSSPLASSPLNLTLELMPNAEFLDRQKLVFLLLVKYLTSPGHYEIPIKGTLGKPAIF